MGWMAGVRFLEGACDFSLLHSIRTGSGAYPASFPVDAGGSFPGVKAARHEAGHSPPSSAEVRNGGSIPPLPYTSSWCSA
jgi:hypothetical protein